MTRKNNAVIPERYTGPVHPDESKALYCAVLEKALADLRAASTRGGNSRVESEDNSEWQIEAAEFWLSPPAQYLIESVGLDADCVLGKLRPEARKILADAKKQRAPVDSTE